MSNEEIKMTNLVSIRQRQVQFIGYIEVKVGLVNLKNTGYIDDKMDSGKQ